MGRSLPSPQRAQHLCRRDVLLGLLSRQVKFMLLVDEMFRDGRCVTPSAHSTQSKARGILYR